jgi:hypothetical protein
MGNELFRVLRSGKVTQLWHSFELCSPDLVRRFLRHLRRIDPVVLTGKHVDRAGVCIDVCDTLATIPAVEVEVEVAVQYLVGCMSEIMNKSMEDAEDLRHRLGYCIGAR